MKTKTRTVQQIFDLMVELDYYSINTDYMCLSLHDAISNDVITLEEYSKASEAISEYLKYLNDLIDKPYTYKSLASCLAALDRDRYNYNGVNTFQINKEIYLDWENRPRFRGKLV